MRGGGAASLDYATPLQYGNRILFVPVGPPRPAPTRKHHPVTALSHPRCGRRVGIAIRSTPPDFASAFGRGQAIADCSISSHAVNLVSDSRYLFLALVQLSDYAEPRIRSQSGSAAPEHARARRYEFPALLCGDSYSGDRFVVRLGS